LSEQKNLVGLEGNSDPSGPAVKEEGWAGDWRGKGPPHLLEPKESRGEDLRKKSWEQAGKKDWKRKRRRNWVRNWRKNWRNNWRRSWRESWKMSGKRSGDGKSGGSLV
jgi:hypothetical protein